jgi:hypothetical protein
VSQSFPNDQTLLGFLLGSLPEEEMEQVRQAMELDPSIAERMASLSDTLLDPLREDTSVYEPSAGLVDRLLEQVDAQKVSASSGLRLGVDATQAFGSEGRSWRDLFATIAATIVVASLLFPSVLDSVESSRRLVCQQQLIHGGTALASFGEITSSRQFPAVDVDGPMAFAGVYSVRLADLGLLDQRRSFWCPSLTNNDNIFIVPSSFQLRTASAEDLKLWQKLAGGSYAYNLGYVIDGRYHAPDLTDRSGVAILADAPLIRGDRDVWLVHAGQGMNILYDDGHTAFVRIDEQFALPDHPFFNRAGKREAGLDPRDSSLGISNQPPFLWSRQQ